MSEETIIKPTAEIAGDYVTIGEGTWVGSKCNLRGVEHKIVIGKNVLIAQLVSIISDSHNYQNIEQDIKHQGIYGKDIYIEDNVWIGCNSVILHGARIGRGSVIGAGSIVDKVIPPYCVAIGSPARIVKRYSFKFGKWLNYSFIIKALFKLKIIN